MAKFQKLPVTIDAALFDGDLVGDVIVDGKVTRGSCPEWFPAVVREVIDLDGAKPLLREGEVLRHADSLFIGTLEGVHEARPGDWIIRGIQGELYPCKPDIFEATYRPAGG